MRGAVASHRFDNSLRYRDEEHPNQTQLTPSYVLEPVREALGGRIDLDPCTEPDNPTGAESFHCPPEDGAEFPWTGAVRPFDSSIYCNPPYGKARERWVERCIEAASGCARVVLLIPAAMDTRVVHRCLESATAEGPPRADEARRRWPSLPGLRVGGMRTEAPKRPVCPNDPAHALVELHTDLWVCPTCVYGDRSKLPLSDGDYAAEKNSQGDQREQSSSSGSTPAGEP